MKILDVKDRPTHFVKQGPTPNQDILFFFRNMRRWQYLHFWTTSDVNNLQTVVKQIYSNTNLEWSMVHWIIDDVTDNYLSFIVNVKQYKKFQ